MTFTSLGRAPARYDAYPPWNLGLIVAVELAIREAWLTLVREQQGLLATHDEDRITDALLETLVKIRSTQVISGFTDEMFGLPVRDAKLPDWQGNIDKTPDITVYPARPRAGISHERHDALFLECKVLHGTRRMTKYGDEGIQRFLDGRYAWRMPHAHMVAYVFGVQDRHPASALKAHFEQKRKKAPHPTNADVLALKGTPIQVAPAGCGRTRPIIQTEHLRSAPVLQGRDNPIVLRHLWLCDPA